MKSDLQGAAGSEGLLRSAGQSLENRILAQASASLAPALSPISALCAAPSWARRLSAPALQSSLLSSTSPSLRLSSSLLSPTLPSSSTLLSSPLLSTQNRLLQSAPLPASLVPPVGLLLPPEGLLLPQPQPLAQAQGPVLGDDVPDGGRGAEEEMLDSDTDMGTELWSRVSTGSASPVDSSECPLSDVYLCEEEEQVPMLEGEEFGEVEAEESSEQEEELKDKKYLLLNEVCCSLVNKETSPGQEGWDKEDSQWMRIKSLADLISQSDPEFLLKVAVYTRQELNIRITANFLLVLAAHLPATKPHLHRYFGPAVQLPSDWLEVARVYSTCFGHSLPSCLKKALVKKFKHFSQYQLAKYNTRKQRCKHSRAATKPKATRTSDRKWSKWANFLGSDPVILQKYLKAQKRVVVDKKASVFSLKKMIQRLHIRDPAELVMAILGKRYPRDAQAFLRSGLGGVWQSERAGQRMKLEQPDTWERSLSHHGNHARTWEGLIDRKALPFMAMLRNLRNMISQGISEAHHRQILARLTNKESVIRSRQFPFRFLSAYKAVLELSKSVKKVPSSKDILRGILKKVPRSKRFVKLDWETASRKRLRVAMGVPFIARIFHMKRAHLQKTSPERCTAEVLARYLQALEQAVQISCKYNVPPLAGRTLLLCNMDLGENAEWGAKQDFCCPPDPDAPPGSDTLTPTFQEVGLLLAMMIGHCSEHSELLLCSSWGFKEAELKSDVLLDNVRHVMKTLETNRSDLAHYPQLLSKLVTKKAKVDTIIYFTGSYIDHKLWEIVDKYRKDVNPEALVIRIHISQTQDIFVGHLPDMGRNSVALHGFSEQILRFIGERGSTRLLEHVERIDKLHNIPPPEGAKDDKNTAVCSLPATPKLRWRSVRVFVSSTFRDMQGERDVLVRSVFPELRRRAAPHCLHLQEVELRWGITEEEATRALELCLAHVCRSQLLLAILGERYGLVPPCPELPPLPQYSWVDSAPAGLSVTEMEIRQFQALHPDSAQNRMLFYFRTPQLPRSVPVTWRSEFASESKDAEAKMTDLKSRILQSGAKVTQDYPCEWGGVTEGKPYVKGLEEFGKAVLDDLWGVLLKNFVEEVDQTELESEVTEQELYHDALQRQCYGRDKLIAAVAKSVRDAQHRQGGSRGVVLLEGGPGQGKTVFMAALANALRSPDKSQKTLGCDVISYNTAASQSAKSVEQLLRCLVQWLRRRLGKEDETLPPTSYKKLLAEFHTELNALSKARKGQSLALLIDGAELVQDARGQPRSDWMPQDLPPGVSLVLSVTPNSALRHTLAKMKGSCVCSLGPLSMLDRKEIVQKELAMFGKKLSDSAFNNQLQTLMMKKGAACPLYLHLACEELRSFAVFEKMNRSLQTLPPAVEPLVQQVLLRLQSQHRGLNWALSALAVSQRGLRERDLYAILSMCNKLPAALGRMKWQEIWELARKPKERIPMATFSQLFRSLQSAIGQPYSQGLEDVLTLSNPEVRSAFEKVFLSKAEDEAGAHCILAAYLWSLCDPQGKDTYFHCEADALVDLPSHLMSSDSLGALHFLLSSFHFLYANVRHGLLHHVLETYSQLESRFQALNEPDGSAPHAWAQGIVGNRQAGGAGGVSVMRWLNKPDRVGAGDSALVSSYLSKPTCVAVSPTDSVAAVGTQSGTLHLVHRETGQEVRSLVSCCDGISACCFLEEGLLASTSFDGQLEVWEIDTGYRTVRVDAHSNRITGCDVSADRKHLATVSLDFNLKVWSPNGTLVSTVPHPCPLNCVTFDPEGHVLAVGGWDGRVHLWSWLRGETLGTLSGHQQSVRSLSFSPSSPLLSSGSLSGEVRLWAVPAASCVGCYRAHQGSAEALNFIQNGELLLSAGDDGLVQVWSGGLGQEVAVLRDDKSQPDSGPAPSAALSVAVSGPYIAVGYHRGNLNLFSVESGERLWSGQAGQGVHSLIWIQKPKASGAEPKGQAETGAESGEEMEPGPFLALAQSSTHLASASVAFSIGLWLLQDVSSNPCSLPSLVTVLRGHRGSVTCLCFSPTGGQLLSGGRDGALLLWQLQPPYVSQALQHSHRDWITGCAWTPEDSTVVSCSRDGRVCVTDLKSGSTVREIATPLSLTSLCCKGEHVIGGSRGGELLLWEWQSGVEVSRIQAHRAPVIQCSILPNTDKENLVVATASDDGTVKLWRPYDVHHHSTVTGHSGGIRGLAAGREGVPAVLTVSDDRSLRSCGVSMATATPRWGSLTALVFRRGGQLLMSPPGFSAPNRPQRRSAARSAPPQTIALCSKQVSDSAVTALACMPDGQFVVACADCSVTVWRLDWNPEHPTAKLHKESSYAVEIPVKFLHFCSILLGVGDDGMIFKIPKSENDYNNTIYSWSNDVRVLGLKPNDNISTWLLGEQRGEVQMAFAFSMGSDTSLSSSFACTELSVAEDKSQIVTDNKPPISALTMDGVCGVHDKGNIWFNQPPNLCSWSRKKPAHSGRVSALRLTESTIISASYDRSVKLWDRQSKRQVGVFVCRGPVLTLELNPQRPAELVCGDSQGGLYFLSWRD
ncbi:hypothetical protein COCON_G00137500 [Conger conger]|uniref:Telomerase protein component 1 n=1 Tax=Conger conger TaxID=82655 RepID=A0A9Q1DF77_CONCO|nr:hypothetical protein COCON_G00137500 [Conger conger]